MKKTIFLFSIILCLFAGYSCDAQNGYVGTLELKNGRKISGNITKHSPKETGYVMTFYRVDNETGTFYISENDIVEKNTVVIVKETSQPAIEQSEAQKAINNEEKVENESETETIKYAATNKQSTSDLFKPQTNLNRQLNGNMRMSGKTMRIAGMSLWITGSVMVVLGLGLTPFILPPIIMCPIGVVLIVPGAILDKVGRNKMHQMGGKMASLYEFQMGKNKKHNTAFAINPNGFSIRF